MKNRSIIFAGLLLLTLALFTACSDSGSGGSSGGEFGETCASGNECAGGICSELDGISYCTWQCVSDDECQQYQAGSCCNLADNYCVFKSQCAALDGGLDGDVTDTDGDLDEPTEEEEPSTGLCEPEERRCRGNSIEVCSRAGDWQHYRDCAAEQICLDGFCEDDLPICEPGEKRCTGDEVEECSEDGKQWNFLEDCGASGTECIGGQCADSCNVEDGCEGELEYCLPHEPGGYEGVCQTFCDRPNVYCPKGWSCERGQCEPITNYCQSDFDCPEMDEYCDRAIVDVTEEGSIVRAEAGLCNRYCFEVGENCPELYKCVDDDPEDENYGRCILRDPTCRTCSNNEVCGEGFYCEIIAGQMSGCCRRMCSPSNPCNPPLTCNPDGICAVGSGENDCGGPCPTGYVCDRTFNTCVIDCPQCPENHCCNAQSAPNCFECHCENPAVCTVLGPHCCAGFSCSGTVYGMAGFCQ